MTKFNRISRLPRNGHTCDKDVFTPSPVTVPIRLFLVAAIAALYVLHQDFWLWRAARPLVFGFLPPGLAYHAAYCAAAALLMWALTRFWWPGHLEDAHREESR